ncbi:MAG: hypothetical protein KME46_32435 [Brasilonema angustatum HA4187-MV1]|jgi:hypothetical protein|nr:hypothetical protein [Brasilonema angustatum HA4187-MV1]
MVFVKVIENSTPEDIPLGLRYIVLESIECYPKLKQMYPNAQLTVVRREDFRREACDSVGLAEALLLMA